MTATDPTTPMNADVIVSPCPFCLQQMPETGFVCSECRLTYREHALYTEKALVHYTTQASRYDRLASLFAALAVYPVQRYRREALASLALHEGDTVLDIGCGTGLSLPFIEDRIGPEGRIVALDYTPAMLQQAGRQAEQHGWRNVQLIQGDAANVQQLVDEPINAAIAAFCLSLVPGWSEAIAGTANLLSAGGRLAVLDWRSTKARGPLRALAPIVEWVTKRYGLADPSLDFSRPRPWCATMEKWLVDVSYREMHFGTTFLCTGTAAGQGTT